MSADPGNLVLQMLRSMRAEMLQTRAELKAGINSLRADVASDLLLIGAGMNKLRKEMGGQIGGLRRAVMEYHRSIVGHGMLITGLEDRVRRDEQHLDLPPQGAH